MLNFYINAMGGKWKFGLLMSWFLLVEAARVGATVWLSHWTDTVDAPGGAPHGPLWYLMIYTIISAVQVSTLLSSLQGASVSALAVSGSPIGLGCQLALQCHPGLCVLIDLSG